MFRVMEKYDMSLLFYTSSWREDHNRNIVFFIPTCIFKIVFPKLVKMDTTELLYVLS